MDLMGSGATSPSNHAFRVCGRLSRRNETPQLDDAQASRRTLNHARFTLGAVAGLADALFVAAIPTARQSSPALRVPPSTG